jgi:hypothetical protein
MCSQPRHPSPSPSLCPRDTQGGRLTLTLTGCRDSRLYLGTVRPSWEGEDSVSSFEYQWYNVVVTLPHCTMWPVKNRTLTTPPRESCFSKGFRVLRCFLSWAASGFSALDPHPSTYLLSDIREPGRCPKTTPHPSTCYLPIVKRYQARLQQLFSNHSHKSWPPPSDWETSQVSYSTVRRLHGDRHNQDSENSPLPECPSERLCVQT